MNIKNLLKSIGEWVHGMWDKLNDKAKELIPIAVNIVEGIKTFNDSTVADFVEHIVTTAIPGTADDLLVEKVRKVLKEWLPKILLELKIIDSVSQLTDDNEKLKAILTELKLTSTKGILYKGIAGKFLELMSDGEFSFDDACKLTTEYFILKKQEDVFNQEESTN